MANWQDTYKQLKKRKKLIDEGVNTTVTKNASKPTINLPSIDNKAGFNSLQNRVNDNLFLPVLTSPSKSKKEDKKWYEEIFTFGEFDDGYQFGDVTKTILGTSTDVIQDVSKGALNLLEAPVDIVTNLTATGFNLAGQEETAKKIRDFADYDLSEKGSRIIANVNPTGMLYNAIDGNFGAIFDPDEANYEESSLMGKYADKTTELVGYGLSMIFGGSVLSGATKTASIGGKTLGASANAGNIGLTLKGHTLNIPTLALAGGTASGLQEANSKEGVTELERWTKGISSGLIEGTTEGLFGMFGVGGIKNQSGKEIFDYLGEKGAKAFSSKAGKVFANIGIKSAGEPIEEFLSYTFNYLVDNHLIDKLGDADFSQEWDWGEVGEQMALAYASSLIMQGGGTTIQNNSAIAEAEKQLNRKLTPEEKALVTQASIEGTVEEKIGTLTQNTQEQTQETTQPVNTPETVQDIDNQIAVLEDQLMKTKNEAEYEMLSQQIKELEQRAEQLETGAVQQDIIPVQEQVQNNEQTTFKTANVEQTNQPTTQEVESNLATDVVSNTQEVANRPVIEETSPVNTGQVKIASEQQIEQQTGQQTTNEQQVMTEEEYLASKGYSFMGYSEAGLHNSSQHDSKSGRKQQMEYTSQKAREYDLKRQELREEYRAKLESGEIRKPTPMEERLKKAQGLDDRPDVQAARRILTKMGIDWKTGKPLQETNNESTNTVENSIEKTGNSDYNKSNKEVMLDEKGIDLGRTRTTDSENQVRENTESREYTTKEWAEFERRATETRKTELSEYEQQLSETIKNNFNKEVVFFDYENSKYLGGASTTNENLIYVSGNKNVTDRTKNFIAHHEVLESDILHNKELNNSYIDVAIEEIINDEGFSKTKDSFIDNQDNLKNVPNRLVAKDIIADIFSEQQTGIDKGYELYLSDTTLEVIDYNLQAFNNEIKIKRNTESKTQEQDIAPIRQDLAETTKDLVKTIKDTTKEVKALKKELNNVKTSVSELVEESKALTEADIPFIEQQQKNAPVEDIAPVRNNLTTEETQELDELEDMPFVLSTEDQARMEELQAKEKGIPEYQYENDNEGTPSEVKDPFKERDFEDVGSRKVKAYQYEHPEVRPFFQEEAQYMLSDLNNSQKGQRYVIGDISQTGGGNFEFSGQKRHTTQDIAELLDSQYNYTYDDIRKGLNAIIEDHGAENIAVAKRIEFALNDRLLKGYTDINGYKIPPNQDYIDLLNEKQFNDYLGNIEQSDIAPVREDFDNDIPMLKVSPKMEQKTTSKNVDWEALEDTSKGDQQRLKVSKLGETLTPNNKNLDTIDETIRGNQQQANLEEGTIEDSIEKKTRKEIKEKLLKETGIINAGLDEANNLPKLLIENTDPIRLQEMVFGRDLGSEINKMFFQKVKDNTSEKIRFQNKERADIKALGIKARSKESAAVQKYGEKQWTNEQTGETLPYGDKELASEFPNVETQKKIKRASEIIRQKYDSYLDTTNKVLTELGYDAIPKRKDYMRHFQELNDVFSRVGVPFNYNEMKANDLPTDINGLTADFSPSKNFFASTLQRKGNKTTYDAITGIDGYLEGVGNLIYHTEDIQRLRAYEQYIRDTYGENHGYDNLEQLSVEEKVARIEKIQDNHLSNYASWLHEYTNTLAGKKALIDRSIESLTGRKIYSFLNTVKTQVGRNMIGFNLSSAGTNAIGYLQALAKTNKLASVKGMYDTVANIFVNDGFIQKNNFLTSRFGSDRLSKNIWQKIGDAGFIFMQGTDNFISQLVVRGKYNELKSKGYTDAQAHAEAGKFASRILSDRSQGAMANIYNSQMLGMLTQFQNEVNNQVYSMFYDTYQESKSNAKNKALKTAAGMTFTLGQMAIFTHLFGKAFESVAGYNPTFDLIEIFMKALGLDDDEESEDTVTENLWQAFEQLTKGLPYISTLTGGGRIPVSEALPLTELFTGKDEFGNDKSRLKTLSEALPYYILPSGYGQIKKTTQGLEMYDEDLPIAGSYTDSGNLRFTAKEDTWSKIQAGLFGRWANDEAKEYVKSEFKTINKNNIEELIDLGMTSSEYRDYRTGLSKYKKVEDKIEYINDLDVTDEQKNIMANNLLDRDYDVDMSIYDDFGSYEEFDFSYKSQEKYEWLKENNISYEDYSYNDDSKELYNYAFKNPEIYKLGTSIIGDFSQYKEYKDYIYDLKADKDSDGNSISGTRKTKVINYINSLDLEIPQKAILIRQEYSSFTEYNYDIVNYVDNLDIPYEDKVSILESLEMEVSDDGTINW